MKRFIFHVDMDAFYASVEQRDHPEYQGRPVVVGADPRFGLGRGVVAACSYEARKFGIHSAMPISQAYRLCPQAVYVRPDMANYVETSGRIRAIFLELTSLVEPVSIDEAFLDLSDQVEDYVEALRAGKRLREVIKGRERLTASVGIGPSKSIAKIASDLRKPDGLALIRDEDVQQFLDPLQVSRLWGVGPRTSDRLKEIGISTVLQLRQADQAALVTRFGKLGEHLRKMALGIDDRPVSVSHEVKSISQERTFSEDTDSVSLQDEALTKMSRKVSERLNAKSLEAQTVILKIRYADFTTFTRQVSLHDPVRGADEILAIGKQLLAKHRDPERKVRLLGLGVASLTVEGSAVQLRLF